MVTIVMGKAIYGYNLKIAALFTHTECWTSMDLSLIQQNYLFVLKMPKEN